MQVAYRDKLGTQSVAIHEVIGMFSNALWDNF